MMKRVLILAYDFPPFISVGGLRPFNWFKYLNEFEIEPIIVTRNWNDEYTGEIDYIAPSKASKVEVEKNEFGTIVKAPYFPNFPNRLLLKYGEHRFKLIRKMCTFFFEITQFIWLSGPKKEIFKAADGFLKNNKVDVIVATGDPFILFHFASKLSTKHRIPWVADYRDPWSFGVGMKGNPFYKNWNRFLERRILRNVSEVTTVSNLFHKKIQSLTQQRVHLLPNGYDPEIMDELNSSKQRSDILTISFIGTMYEWHPIKMFLRVLNNFVEEHGENTIRLNLYGINNHEYVQLLLETKFIDLKNVVTIFPRLPNEEVLRESSKSDLLLLFNYYAIIGTKIYDYMGLKIPIVFCFSEDKKADKLRDKHKSMHDFVDMPFDVQQKLIESKNAGVIVKNTEHLLTVLHNFFEEYKRNGSIKCTTENSEEFSRRNQTGKLAEIVHSLSFN